MPAHLPFNTVGPSFGGSRKKRASTTSEGEKTLTGVGIAVIRAATARATEHIPCPYED